MKKNITANLYASIKEVINKARSTVYRAVNNAMVETYWHIGRLIMENEQQGAERAEYGEKIIGNLARKLTAEFGKGFTPTNLKYMRQFYQVFPNRHALSDQLSWTHYRLHSGPDPLHRKRQSNSKVFGIKRKQKALCIEIHALSAE